MHSLKKKKLSFKILPLEHLNRMALSKDETALSLRLLERCYRLLNFLYSFGLKQLQLHAILKTDQSSSQLMRKWHITSLMTENPQLNIFTSLASDYDNPDPAPKLQNGSPLADTTVPSQQELDILLSSSSNIDPEMCMFALTVSIVELKNIKEAMADSAWIEAMQEELYQFDRLQVWELVDKPFGKNVTKLKWLLKNKKDEDQTVIRNKARLVAKGYAKEEGIDFEESFC
ncbi:retrovirus-related pol polyprotein from transposon TNT 1-94 [Tanacetum coccineum]